MGAPTNRGMRPTAAKRARRRARRRRLATTRHLDHAHAVVLDDRETGRSDYPDSPLRVAGPAGAVDDARARALCPRPVGSSMSAAAATWRTRRPRAQVAMPRTAPRRRRRRTTSEKLDAASLSRPGQCWSNAVAESRLARLKDELLYWHVSHARASAGMTRGLVVDCAAAPRPGLAFRLPACSRAGHRGRSGSRVR